MSFTEEMLDRVRRRMLLDVRGWRYGPTPRYRRHYRRLARLAAYLERRLAR